MKEKITFRQLMQYADPETEPKIMIQIVVDDEEWDGATELWVGSPLLKPFMDYVVDEIGYEESYFDKKPLIRVSISKPGVEEC